MFIVYETTCLVNGKKYIGVHQQETDDDYLGSGKSIVYAIKKYGKNKFIRETLETFDNAEDAYRREAEIVTQEICDSTFYYNIVLGGNQPPNHTGLKRNSLKYAEANKKRWNDKEYKKRVSESMRRNHTRKKSITIDGIEYISQRDASKALNISPQLLSYRLKNNFYCS